ncbi:MAG: winged helix-turn-helix transcriptional regulator [Fibrobacter sp.]|nr:winged helix-turn-helix transcriptional regulator [Fibrobacter sp.]
MNKFLNRLSERSGRGVPKIVGAYGRESIKIEKNFIVVTIPFNRINVTPFELNEGAGSDVPNGSQKGSQKSSQKILRLIAENARITTQEMADALGVSRRAIAKQLANMQAEGIVKRIGPDKGGYQKIL